MGSTTSTDADELIRTYASAASSCLSALLTEAAADLGLERTEEVLRLGRALSAAFVEGIRTGESEMLAQALEQGADLHVRRIGPLPDAA
jgi:hypothetical protein